MKHCLLAVHLLVALAAALGCREKTVPFKPPPPDDAPAQSLDAAPPPVDAAPEAAAPKPTKVVVGDHVSCAVMSDATARCWGKNSEGQLGNGTIVDSPKPVKLPLRGVTDVVVGTAHGCALLDHSSVTCWGLINFGKSTPLLVPTAVPGLASAKRIFAVGTASCATLATGPLVCWGDVDTKGRPRLSVGAPQHRVPTPVPGVKNAIAVVTNGALTEDNTMVPFGEENAPLPAIEEGDEADLE